MTKLSAQQLHDRLMALIGYFDIDPNRMLDLVLESFEYHFQYTKIYVELLELLHFDRMTICQLIGFKFQQYQVDFDSKTFSSRHRTNSSLVTRRYATIVVFTCFTIDCTSINSNRRFVTTRKTDENQNEMKKNRNLSNFSCIR